MQGSAQGDGMAQAAQSNVLNNIEKGFLGQQPIYGPSRLLFITISHNQVIHHQVIKELHTA
jgi:hypothetical protein